MSAWRSARRGVTLIELMVASAVGVVVLTAGVALVTQAAQASRRTRSINEMRRAATRILGQLEGDLRVAGLGVPKGARKAPPNEVFPRAFLSATQTSMSFLGDVPRPDSSLNGFARIADDCQLAPAGTRPPDGLPILDELNNNCDIRTPGCDSTASSNVVPPATADCATSGGISESCPWALGKYHLNEQVIVQDADGSWSELQLDGLHLFELSGSRYVLKLSAAPATPPVTAALGAFTSTPDRIFWDFNAGPKTVTRQQCWASVQSPLDFTRAITCAQGTATEAMAANVTAVSFDYLNAGGASLLSGATVPPAALQFIRRVKIKLTLQGFAAAGAPTETFTALVALREP